MKLYDLCSQENLGTRVAYLLVPETDTGGRGEYPQARERTPVKELCKLLL
jgi:hypothetical protein